MRLFFVLRTPVNAMSEGAMLRFRVQTERLLRRALLKNAGAYARAQTPTESYAMRDAQRVRHEVRLARYSSMTFYRAPLSMRSAPVWRRREEERRW